MMRVCVCGEGGCVWCGRVCVFVVREGVCGKGGCV